MSQAYEQSGDWRMLAMVAGLHVLGMVALLNVEPVAHAVGLQQPLMVSLLAEVEPEPPKEPPKPLPPKPPVPEIKPDGAAASDGGARGSAQPGDGRAASA
jgi:hypothetical protein